MGQKAPRRMTSARIPAAGGEFKLFLYRDEDGDKEHLALVLGSVAQSDKVLVRIHSECFTGDVLGSKRCDCGQQLSRSIRLIVEEGVGVLVYLRQEGRGIGLLDKLRAYNLQDEGYDTVEANEILGHQGDGRDYDIAAHILRDLEVRSLRLLTNNPAKIESLAAQGFETSERVALQPTVTRENARYLATKARRMRHLLDLGTEGTGVEGNGGEGQPARAASSVATARWSDDPVLDRDRPTVTLTYAQSLDGSITVRRGESMALSCSQSLVMTHELRARHDAILVGIETVLADDPQLTVRLIQGPDPQPIVLDSHLRTPLDAALLANPGRSPWIATTSAADEGRQRALAKAGARVLRLPTNHHNQVDLKALLRCLHDMGIESLMVEGGARVITSFLVENLVDRLVLTIAPLLIGGLNAVGNLGELNGRVFPEVLNPQYQWVGESLILSGDLVRSGH